MNKALVIVDMQNDFISGTLAVPGAWEIIAPIQDYAAEFYRRDNGLVILTRCWHPENHCSFKEHGGPWPTHCVAHTKGAELQVGLKSMVFDYNWWLVSKGIDARLEEYSAIDKLWPLLQNSEIQEVEVCGLARDYCVADTAKDLEARGYKVTILEHLCRAVNREGGRG